MIPGNFLTLFKYTKESYRVFLSLQGMKQKQGRKNTESLTVLRLFAFFLSHRKMEDIK